MFSNQKLNFFLHSLKMNIIFSPHHLSEAYIEAEQKQGISTSQCIMDKFIVLLNTISNVWCNKTFFGSTDGA